MLRIYQSLDNTHEGASESKSGANADLEPDTNCAGHNIEHALTVSYEIETKLPAWPVSDSVASMSLYSPCSTYIIGSLMEPLLGMDY